MATTLDIIGSFFLFGILSLALLNLNANLAASSLETSMSLVVQEDIVELSHALDYDMLKIGFMKNGSSFNQAQCDSTMITWYSDIDINGTVDTLSYYLGEPTELSHTPNPLDRILYRKVNGDTPTPLAIGVVNFHLAYYDSVYTQIPYDSLRSVVGVNLVRGINVQVMLENPNTLLGEKPQVAYFERTYFPYNLWI